jgi:hypothetical protein
MLRSVHAAVPLLCIALSCLPGASARGQGGVFVTGHDPDFHAFQGGNTTGAQHLIQDAVSFVTNHHGGNILLVTDLHNPGGGYSDPRLGLTAAGLTFDVADDGSAGGAVKDLHTVNFSNYGAVIVASDFGGWLRQSELDILIARESQIISYVNGGGGLVALAESGPPAPGLLTHDAFGFLPFLVTSAQKNESEVGNTVTPFGASLGLTDSDVNGNASHNVFTSASGLNIVDVDSQQQILSLAFYGLISPSGPAVPEPGPLSLSLVGAVGTTAVLLLRKSLRGRSAAALR